jgi:phospholipase/lecithinase/hemolysin
VDYFALSVTHFAPVTAFFITDQPSEHGMNFAVGGSTSGDVNVLPGPKPIQSFPAQIGAYVASLRGKSAANDLCVIWIGANDFGAGLAAGSINPRATVENIRADIAQLSSAAPGGASPDFEAIPA